MNDKHQFILKLLEILLSWPVIVFILVLILRTSITAFINRLSERIRKAEIAGNTFEFDKLLTKVNSVSARLDDVTTYLLTSDTYREREAHLSLAAKMARRKVFENFKAQLDAMAPEARYEVQRNHTESYLAQFAISVAQLKRDLTDTGFYSGPINDILDFETITAICAFQSHCGITADGIFGQESLSHLHTLKESPKAMPPRP